LLLQNLEKKKILKRKRFFFLKKEIGVFEVGKTVLEQFSDQKCGECGETWK
jgi:hypothetical protein